MHQNNSDREPSSDRPPLIQEGSISNTKISEPNHFTGLFEWPVDSARLSRGFSAAPTGRRHRPHLGIDLAASKGTPIYAAQDGIVIYTGQEFRGYGRMIMIEGKSNFATLYAHLSKIIARQGQHVTKGTVIGAMGRTGHASGVHLHFEIRKDRGAVDPLLYLPNTKVASDLSGDDLDLDETLD